RSDRDWSSDVCSSDLDLIERTAAQHPDRPAVVMAGTHVTYAELHRRVRAFAGYAQSLGVGPGVLAPICVERGIDMVICVLGILRSEERRVGKECRCRR